MGRTTTHGVDDDDYDDVVDWHSVWVGAALGAVAQLGHAANAAAWVSGRAADVVAGDGGASRR